MRIGIDFDNTLVRYDVVFNSIAVKLGLKPGENPKEAVKNYLISSQGNTTLWKETQALVYGDLIREATFLPDFVEFYDYIKSRNIEFFIVSYKTRFARLKGTKVSLHGAANLWIDHSLSFLEKSNIFYETAVTKKVRRIASLDLDYYVDDLLTVLYHKDFPKSVRKVLMTYETASVAPKKKNLSIINNWTQMIDIIKKN
uniref:hypothetical protein n=1 Tax=Algoriphagus sp. TaxID=1872435 RepID=UPI0040488FC1